MTSAVQSAIRITVFFGGVALIGAWSALSLGPDVIADAYHQNSSISVLNEIFAKQPPRPLSLYQSVLKSYTVVFVVAWCAMGVTMAFVSQPRFQRWWEIHFGTTRTSWPVPQLGYRRTWMIAGMIASFIGFALFAALSGLEPWPFCPYSMYANSRAKPKPAALVYRVFAVAENSDQEFYFSPPHFPPMIAERAERSFAAWHQKNDQERIERGLRDLLVRYNYRYASSSSASPLRALRLYAEAWDELDPWATDRNVPQHRTLITTVDDMGGAR